jgi:hypothetical protein
VYSEWKKAACNRRIIAEIKERVRASTAPHPPIPDDYRTAYIVAYRDAGGFGSVGPAAPPPRAQVAQSLAARVGGGGGGGGGGGERGGSGGGAQDPNVVRGVLSAAAGGVGGSRDDAWWYEVAKADINRLKALSTRGRGYHGAAQPEVIDIEVLVVVGGGAKAEEAVARLRASLAVEEAEEGTREEKGGGAGGAGGAPVLPPVLGFDTETRPCFVKKENRAAGDPGNKTAVIQLSSSTLCVVFCLDAARRDGGITEGLRALIADPAVVKVGQGIEADVVALNNEFGVVGGGIVNLEPLSVAVGVKHGSRSLRALTAIFLEARLTKGQQMSNWENRPLTAAQTRYAALDAYVGFAIFRAMFTRHGHEQAWGDAYEAWRVPRRSSGL